MHKRRSGLNEWNAIGSMENEAATQWETEYYLYQWNQKSFDTQSEEREQ